MSNATQNTGNEKINTGTSPTTFGQSVESQAQIADAEAIASATTDGETLNIYRLTPTAPQNDARWHSTRARRDLVVAARTAGDARIVAAGSELDYMEVEALPGEDVTTRHASLFRDEKAYTVVELERDRRDLKRGVIAGEVRTDTITPVQE
nr:hypothetical protein RKHAN_02268 [Rhizobium sp. Khangiran2]